MQSCLVATNAPTIVVQGSILEGFWVTFGFLWAPKGGSEAVFRGVEILVEKRAVRHFREQDGGGLYFRGGRDQDQAQDQDREEELVTPGAGSLVAHILWAALHAAYIMILVRLQRMNRDTYGCNTRSMLPVCL